MRKRVFYTSLLVITAWALFLYAPEECLAQFGDIFRDIKGAVSPGSGQSTPKIAEALKEALRVGSENAVALVSKKDGFLAEEAIKILLPPSVKRTEKVLRAIGYGSQLDEFEVSMNRAAERAAPIAKDIFVKALSELTIADAEKILKGEDTAATQYFKEKTQEKLFHDLKPIVHSSMVQVGVTRRYLELEQKTKSVPFADPFNFNLDDYVTSGALDGLFFMLGREEKRIRNDPSARVTDLLREVFGKR